VVCRVAHTKDKRDPLKQTLARTPPTQQSEVVWLKLLAAMGGPPNLATWSPRQHRGQRTIRPSGALCPEFLHSRGVACACRKATFAPITGRHGRVDQLHMRPVSGHAVEDEIASCAPLAWVCAGDGRAISSGRLVCDRPTRRTLPDASLPPPSHRALRSERL